MAYTATPFVRQGQKRIAIHGFQITFPDVAMNILVTGSTGFIGSHVLIQLVKEGHDVTVIVRARSKRTRIESIVSDVNFLEFDLNDADTSTLNLDDRNFELCIHLAWYAEPGLYLHSTENVQSLSATLNLASRLAQSGCQKFLGIGSSFEYDSGGGYLSESSALNPRSLYAACKTAASIGLEKIADDTDMQVAWVRLFNQYGPFENERRLVPDVLLSLMRGEKTRTTEGNQFRDFLHVEDVASAICAVAFSELSGSVNVGSGQPIRVRDIVEKLGEVTGREDLIDFGAIPYRESDPMFLCANNQLLVNNTQWEPQYDLDNGLRHTLAWWTSTLG